MVVRGPATAICIFLAFVGCRQADRIETYTVPKEAPRVVAAADARAGSDSKEATDRMLAAILPDGGKAWFLKVVGPEAAVAEREQSINDFFATVRPAPEKSHPDWKLPEGWEERAGSGMRAATIVVPTSGKPLEISVTSLPWTGSPEEMLRNINRWRGQMQLASTNEQGLADCSHELAAGDVKTTVVELRGHMKSGGMSPPFAGGVLSPVALLPRPAGHQMRVAAKAAVLRIYPLVIPQSTAHGPSFQPVIHRSPQMLLPHPKSRLR